MLKNVDLVERLVGKLVVGVAGFDDPAELGDDLDGSGGLLLDSVNGGLPGFPPIGGDSGVTVDPRVQVAIS